MPAGREGKGVPGGRYERACVRQRIGAQDHVAPNCDREGTCRPSRVCSLAARVEGIPKVYNVHAAGRRCERAVCALRRPRPPGSHGPVCRGGNLSRFSRFASYQYCTDKSAALRNRECSCNGTDKSSLTPLELDAHDTGCVLQGPWPEPQSPIRKRAGFVDACHSTVLCTSAFSRAKI